MQPLMGARRRRAIDHTAEIRSRVHRRIRLSERRDSRDCESRCDDERLNEFHGDYLQTVLFRKHLFAFQ